MTKNFDGENYIRNLSDNAEDNIERMVSIIWLFLWQSFN